MGAPSAWIPYDQFLNQLGKKTLDLNADTFKIALFQSTSDCGNKAHVTAKYSDFTNEVANGNGYTTGGASVGVGTFVNIGGIETFDVGDATWTATGAGFSARFAVLYDSTDANKRAVAYALLDSAPADYVVTTALPLTLLVPVVFTMQAA